MGYGRSAREAHKAERWGEKYQWMAYHELLARVADNYQASRHFDDSLPYGGLHQITGDREIDPSLPPIDYRVFNEKNGVGATAWNPPLIQLQAWPPERLDFQRYQGDINRFVADTVSEPTVAGSLFVRDRHGNDWVVLDGSMRQVDPRAHKGWRGLQETTVIDTLLIPAGDGMRSWPPYLIGHGSKFMTSSTRAATPTAATSARLAVSARPATTVTTSSGRRPWAASPSMLSRRWSNTCGREASSTAPSGSPQHGLAIDVLATGREIVLRYARAKLAGRRRCSGVHLLRGTGERQPSAACTSGIPWGVPGRPEARTPRTALVPAHGTQRSTRRQAPAGAVGR